MVLIALDGISVEGFEKAELPNIDNLMEEGVLSLNTRNVMPSVTLPNWTSHLCGSGPEQHGVVSNGWKQNKYILPAVEKDEKGYFPSIFKVLKKQVPEVKTAFYYNWLNLIYPYNQEYIDEVSFQENDAYYENYNKAFDFIVENKENPTLVFLYTVHTDHAGHKFGWMSDEYIKSIEEADVKIGEFIQKLKEQDLYEETHFMFLSDHGGIGRKGHGNISTTEMEVPWGITGPGIKSGFIMLEPNNTVNTASVIAYLFDCKNPLGWTAEVPASIFDK
ncbi:MAG: alkaline phosphatase family protein [Bacteroidota bacterium]